MQAIVNCVNIEILLVLLLESILKYKSFFDDEQVLKRYL